MSRALSRVVFFILGLVWTIESAHADTVIWYVNENEHRQCVQNCILDRLCPKSGSGKFREFIEPEACARRDFSAIRPEGNQNGSFSLYLVVDGYCHTQCMSAGSHEAHLADAAVVEAKRIAAVNEVNDAGKQQADALQKKIEVLPQVIANDPIAVAQIVKELRAQLELAKPAAKAAPQPTSR